MERPWSMWEFFLAALVLGALPLRAQDLADVFARVSPSVVTIHAVEARVTGEPKPRLQAQAKTGSGILLDAQGTVLTAAHVVELANEVEVEFADGDKRKASVVAAEPGADLALVRVTGELPPGAAPCVLADSSAVRIGNEVFAVGAPLGMGHTLTAGHVSARRRDEVFMGDMRFVEHFQTDAAINPGNPGGPLFDRNGQVVGIVCHIATSSIGSEGLGFAVTSSAVRELLLGGDIVLAVQGHPVVSASESDEAMQALRGLTAEDTLRLSGAARGQGRRTGSEDRRILTMDWMLPGVAAVPNSPNLEETP